MEFVKNGFSIYLNRDNNESYDMFYKRGWFIISQIDNNTVTKQTCDKIISYSKIWINMKYYNCNYTTSIEKEIKKMEQNILVIN